MSMQFPIRTSTGKFQTRNSRIVLIRSNETIQELQSNGERVNKRLWNGDIMKADGKTVDTSAQWEDDGAFRNQRGVACPSDLVIKVSEEVAA